jgi:hypothetical protein
LAPWRESDSPPAKLLQCTALGGKIAKDRFHFDLFKEAVMRTLLALLSVLALGQSQLHARDQDDKVPTKPPEPILVKDIYFRSRGPCIPAGPNMRFTSTLEGFAVLDNVGPLKEKHVALRPSLGPNLNLKIGRAYYFKLFPSEATQKSIQEGDYTVLYVQSRELQEIRSADDK